MNAFDKHKLVNSYNDRLTRYGYSPRTLGWDKQRHALRFHVLLSQWDIRDCEILDFGCGFGDLFGYLGSRGISARYHGIDINENLIRAGKAVYPEAELSCRDALAEGLDRSYDYIFSSGVHNFRFEVDNWPFIERSFELFNEYSRRGFAVNFISDKVHWQRDDICYSNPGRILELAYAYSNRLVLRNDYMPFEFTIFVDKQNEFNRAKGVYREYESFVGNGLNTSPDSTTHGTGAADPR